MEYLKLDGSETGLTAGTKINGIIDAMNMQPKLGTDIDNIKDSGYFEVDTNLPDGMGLGELRVGWDVSNKDKLIQEYKSLFFPFTYRRISNDAGATWTSWQEDEQTQFNQTVAERFDNTYTKLQVNRMVVNTYTGVEVPSPSLGKTGDMYHRFQTKLENSLQTGVSAQEYKNLGFNMYIDNTSSGMTELYIAPNSHEIYTYWGDNGAPKAEDFVLNVNGTDIPLTVDYQTAGGIDFTYPSSFDSVIQAVTIGTSFDFKGSVLTGKDEDYTNFDGNWYYTPIFDHTYDFKKAGISEGGNPVVISGQTFQEIVRLTTLPRAAGVYEYKFSITFGYSTTSRSALFQWSLDGGNSWETFSLEVKDTTNKMPRTYEFPINRQQNGTIDLILQGACEGASDTLTVDYASIVAERKK